jgi:quinoprotein glucose dehydrogenase
MWRWAVGIVPLVALVVWATLPVTGQTQKGEWRTYGGDLASTRYSPLEQINASNFNNLEVAWELKTDNFAPRPENNNQTTPLMVNGMLYFTAGNARRSAVAARADTGEIMWKYSIDEGQRGTNAPRQLSGRGVAYWTDGRNDQRVIYVTPGYQMVALNAKTGAPVSTFGKDGIVDLKADNDQILDPVTGELGLHSAPIIGNDVVVIGAALLAGGSPTSKTKPKGYVRGFDVRTGKKLWLFHTIPRPGEFGNETWEKDSWSYTGNTGVWAQMSIDEQLNTLYMGVELPTGDYYGGNRPGAGLFGESLVALDLKTGKRKWHYQLVHHGIWDMDIPCAPILADIVVDGKPIKAVLQPTKQSWVYVFDRVTGVPVWPIEERPVEKGTVPGEWYSPTQPFVTKPPAFDVQGVSIDDLIDFTPALRAEAVQLVSRYKIGPIFTPPVESKFPEPLATLVAPTVTGGANWQGGSFDPETKMFYIFSNTGFSPLGLVPADPARTDFGFSQGTARNPAAAAPAGGARGGGGRGGAPGAAPVAGGAGAAGAPGGGGGRGAGGGGGGRGAGGGGRGGAAAGGGAPQDAFVTAPITAAANAAADGDQPPAAAGRGARGGGAAPAGGGGGGAAAGEGGGGLSVQGLPLNKPPYGRITALDMNKGTLVWQIPHGDTADNIKATFQRLGINYPARTGRQGRIGVLTTKSLVIAGEGGFVVTANGKRGALLRAYDKATGKDAGSVYMPAPQTGSPMTYMLNGRQYISLAIGGAGFNAEIITFRLPAEAIRQ